MLTTETIKQNCEGISDELAAKIASLSKDDEEKVIGARFGEVYRQLDGTIEKATGIKRDGDEKTYVYLERAAKEIKAAADTATKDVESLKEENAKLQKAIADGSTDNATKEKLAQAEKDLASIREQYNMLKIEYDGAKDKFAKDLFHVKIENSVTAAFGGVKFKDNLSTAVIDLAKKTVMEKIKAANPEDADDGNGGTVIVFKDGNGAIMRNPDNSLNPYTVGDLALKELTALGVVAGQRKQTGSGNKGGSGNGGNGGFDISGARTQNEAYEMIAQTLFAKGLANGSKEFDAEMQKAWTELGVSKLPQK